MNWTLRPAETADCDAVTALWQACGLVVPANDPRAEFHLARGAAASDILLAVDGPRVLGSAMIGHDGHRGWLYYLATAPNARGHGIARALIARAEAWLTDRRIPKLQLLVRSTNTGVIGLYESLGFARHPVLVMQKVLIPKKT